MMFRVFDQPGSVYFGTCLQFVSNKCKCKMCPTGGGSLNTHINSYRPWTSPGRLIYLFNVRSGVVCVFCGLCCGMLCGGVLCGGMQTTTNTDYRL